MNIKVSLIIPYYNSTLSIEKCLSAVFNQSYKFHEIIVVNNNSTEESLRTLKKHQNIKILDCKKQGAAAARNLGWKSVKSDYVAFIDADTIITTSWNEQMVKHLARSGASAVQSRIIPDKSLSTSDFLFNYRYAKKEQSTEGTFIELNSEKKIIALNTAACIYKKSILNKTLGFEENLLRLEDTDLALKASAISTLDGCLLATASVQYDGSIFSYLKRSYNDGKSQCVFNQLWDVDEIKFKIFSTTKKFFLFESLNNILFIGGFYCQKIFGQSYNASSLQLTRLIRRTRQ